MKLTTIIDINKVRYFLLKCTSLRTMFDNGGHFTDNANFVWPIYQKHGIRYIFDMHNRVALLYSNMTYILSLDMEGCYQYNDFIDGLCGMVCGINICECDRVWSTRVTPNILSTQMELCSTCIQRMQIKVPDDKCSICLDPLNKHPCTITRCKHTYHIRCMIKLVKHQTQCPLCRAEISELWEDDDQLLLCEE